MNRAPPWAIQLPHRSTVEMDESSLPGSFNVCPPGMAAANGLRWHEISGSPPSYSGGRYVAARLAADAGLLERHFTALRKFQSLGYPGFVHGLYSGQPPGPRPPPFFQSRCQLRQSFVGLIHVPIK